MRWNGREGTAPNRRDANILLVLDIVNHIADSCVLHFLLLFGTGNTIQTISAGSTIDTLITINTISAISAISTFCNIITVLTFLDIFDFVDILDFFLTIRFRNLFNDLLSYVLLIFYALKPFSRTTFCIALHE